MSQTPPTSDAAAPATKSMDDIVALCRRRGFIFQSSEIYGGINGFWDYGPLGTELKRNLKNAWWQDVVQTELPGPDGHAIDMVGLDCTIIMHPKVWEASGHVAGFNDPMVDDRETKQRFRADHLMGIYPDVLEQSLITTSGRFETAPIRSVIASNPEEAFSRLSDDKQLRKSLGIRRLDPRQPSKTSNAVTVTIDVGNGPIAAFIHPVSGQELVESTHLVPSPFTGAKGTLTPPRDFNLMFETYVGAVKDEESKAWLRPETAQGIFVNFWNVIDSTRVRVPFGIAQEGKAFRNEVTPRNFTFRSREFEQMEIEFFIHPSTAAQWYAFWRDQRYKWWQSIGLAGANLQLREHEKDELAHYAKDGAGTSDIEYRFPFTAPGFGELEGVAHRADYDLKAHATMCGKGDKLKYFDQERQVRGEPEDQYRYFPHVIEPSAGADRGTLALICEAFTPDETRPSKVFMKFHPRMAPIKAAVFPLVNKDGMPEIAEKLYRELRKKHIVEYDPKQSIGKRYARMDEAGTPFCFTIDSQTLQDQTVTVRHRDSQQQERIGIDHVAAFLTERIGA